MGFVKSSPQSQSENKNKNLDLTNEIQQNNMAKTMQNLPLKFKLFRSSGLFVKNAKDLYPHKIDIYTKSTKKF